MHFQEFESEQHIAEFARQYGDIFSADESLTVAEIGDGNLNFVYRISGDNQSLIVKQALPYIRVIGEGWPLTQDRIRIEAQALKLAAEKSQRRVPEVHYFCSTHCAILMEDIGDHISLRDALCQRKPLPQLVDSLAGFLADSYFETSDLAMGSQARKALITEFSNPQLCNISEEVYFWDPFCDHERNQVNPGVRAKAEALWEDDAVALAVAKLKAKFMSQPQALLHGDLHTGSVFVTDDSCKLIDPEFAFCGPIGFDLGTLVANFLLSYAGHANTEGSAAERGAFRDWLLETVNGLWEGFSTRFEQRMKADTVDPNMKGDLYCQYYLQSLLQDSLGFAAVEMTRRTIGIAHVNDIEGIADPDVRACSEALSLDIARYLLLNADGIESMSHAVEEISQL